MKRWSLLHGDMQGRHLQGGVVRLVDLGKTEKRNSLSGKQQLALLFRKEQWQFPAHIGEALLASAKG